MKSGPVITKIVVALLTAAALNIPAATAAENEHHIDSAGRSGLSLTIYNADLALIGESRPVSLVSGANLLALGDVSAQLLPESVLVAIEGAAVREQRFSYDLLTPQSLLEASLGRQVLLIDRNPVTGEEQIEEAEVVSVTGGLVLRVGDRLETAPPGRIAFRELPAGLRDVPTLVVAVDSPQSQDTRLDLHYLTQGLSWGADYVAQIDAAGGTARLIALVTLHNQSGTDFEGASVQLVAGDVSRVGPVALHKQERMLEMQATATPMSDVPPQSASDRYLYVLDRSITLHDRERRQLPLFTATEVSVRKIYRVDGAIMTALGRRMPKTMTQATLLLEFENIAAKGLGQPLPAGVMRVYESPQAGGAPIFAGEDLIGHTAEGEILEVRLGSAFDVTTEARTTDFRRLSGNDGSFEAAQEIEVRNAKTEPVEVELIGWLPHGWEMLNETQAHERLDAERVRWTVEVQPQGKATLSYRIRVIP